MNVSGAGDGRLSPTAAPASHTVEIGDISIHHLAWGADGAPPLVLLHGGGQSAWTWQRVAERFAGRYYVIAPDARGHGDSGWSPDGVYSIDRFRDDLHALVTRLGLADFVLIGMSMGGMTALAYGGAYGATLRGLVVIDIAPAVSLLGRDLGLTLTIPAGFPAVDVNSLRYKDLIQDLVLVGRDPGKFETKYATLLTAAQREEFCRTLSASRPLAPELADLVRRIPGQALPMDAVRSAVSLAAHHDPDVADGSREANLRKSVRLLAQLPALIGAWHAAREGRPAPAVPVNRSHAAYVLQ